VLFWSIAVCGTSFDLATKSIVFAKVGFPAPAVPVVPRILEIQTSHNPGALWGFGATLPGSSVIFAGLSVIAAIVICYFLFFLGASSSRILTIALGLIMAGAMGNCYDRLAFGYVRDFVHFHVDPIGFDCAIFNFADNMLIAGAVALVLYALRPEKAPSGEPGDTLAHTGYHSEREFDAPITGPSEHLGPAEPDRVAGSLRARGSHSATPKSQSIHSF
jgi:signal peptidase II